MGSPGPRGRPACGTCRPRRCRAGSATCGSAQVPASRQCIVFHAPARARCLPCHLSALLCMVSPASSGACFCLYRSRAGGGEPAAAGRLQAAGHHREPGAPRRQVHRDGARGPGADPGQRSSIQQRPAPVHGGQELPRAGARVFCFLLCCCLLPPALERHTVASRAPNEQPLPSTAVMCAIV